MKHPKVAFALMNLRPGIQCCVFQDPGEDVRIEVFDGTVLPTEEEILAECQRMDDNGEELSGYADCRKVKYPPLAEQMDMLVKDAIDGGTRHRDACVAIKEQFPKPE